MEDRRLLLAVLPDDEFSGTYAEILSSEYDLMLTHDPSEGLKLLTENPGRIAAAVIDINVSKAGGFKIINYISHDSLFVAVPVILLSRSVPTDEDVMSLSLGFSEFIYLPCPASVILKRIDNAIKAKDSLTFSELERILKELPSIIYLKDREGKYIFVSQSWYQLHEHDEPGWTVRGKTELEIRMARENALKAMETDKEVFETGRGVSYVIEEKTDNGSEFFEVIKRPTHDAQGNVSGIIALVNNVTNHQLLKRELEKRSRMDPLTGLLNKKAAEEMAQKLLARSDSLNALMLFDVDLFKSINDTFGHAAGDRVLASIGRLLRDSVGPNDVVGRVGGDEFMALLRDVPSPEAALDTARAFISALVSEPGPDLTPGSVTVSMGLALSPAHGREFTELYRSADSALYYVKEHGRNGVKVFGD